MQHIQQGQGDYLILVHGALTDHSMWSKHIQHFSQNFDVIAVTLRHFMEECSGEFGLNTHAQELQQFLSNLPEKKSTYIVGWSYGADVVLNLMVSNPSHRITKAFLYEPGYPGCVEKKAMQKWQIDVNAMFSRVFESYYAGDLKAAVEHLIDGSGDQKGYFSSQKTEVKALQISKAHTLHKQLNQQESPAICKESVSKIKTSLIIAYGSNTRTLFKEVAKATIDVSTVAEKMIVLGYGHMLPQESPLVFSEYIQSTILQRS